MQGDTQSVGRRFHHQSWIIVGVALIALIAFAACHAPSSDSVPIEVVSRAASEPTLRYLRTENIAEANEPARYVDVFELRNGTMSTLRYRVLSNGFVTAGADVLTDAYGWCETNNRICVFGSRLELLPPGRTAEVRTQSWLRPTRMTWVLRDTPDVPWYDDPSGPINWFFVTTEPFDSSLAAPGVPPVLMWDEEVAQER